MTVAARAKKAAGRAKKLDAIREKKLADADARFRKAWGDRQPVYGDPDQIKLLKQWRWEIGIASREHDEAANATGLRAFRVSFESVTVYAACADEAEDIASEHEASIGLIADDGPAPDDAEEGVEEW